MDISAVTKNKLKGKIRRKAKALLRWKTKTDASYERAARALIRAFNKKYFNEKNDRNPYYIYQPIKYVRYLNSGRHYKGNYKITYDDIKKMGFRSLVHEYFTSRAIQIEDPDN